MSTSQNTTLIERVDPDWIDPDLPPDFGGAPIGGGFGSYLHALRRRWPVALLLGLLVGAAAATAAWLWLPRTYTATAVLRIASTEKPLLFHTADATVNNPFDIYKRTQKQLLVSRFVVANALSDTKDAESEWEPEEVLEQRRKTEATLRAALQNHDDPVAWLTSELRVSFPDDAEIMHVELSADRPTGLAEVVNAVVKAYLSEVVEAERGQRIARLSSLEKVKSEAELELRRTRTQLTELMNTLGDESEAPSVFQQSVLQRFSALQLELTELRLDSRQNQAELELLQQGGPEEQVAISDYELEEALAKDRTAAQLILQREALTQAMKETQRRMVASKAQPRLDEFQRQIDVLDERLQARRKAVREEALELKKQMIAEQRRALEQQLTAKRPTLARREEILTAELNAVAGEAADFGRPSIEVELKRAEAETLETVLTRMGDEIAKTKVELQPEEEDSLRVRTLTWATPPRSADVSSRMVRAGGAAGAGLMLPFVLLVWLDARKRRINTPAEVTGQLHLNMLGSLPRVPNRVMRQLSGSSRQAQFWRSLLSESVDSIAAVILSSADARRVIMVSSATAGEGKTTLAGHLAISLAAAAGRRTLLIDFDLRRPALHRIFGLEPGPGVGELLRGELSVQDAIQETEIPNLELIAAGSAKLYGLGLLSSSSALEALFAELRSKFDFILVDGCPILPVVDTRLVARHADAVILSVLRDVSRAPKITAACEILESFKIPLLGVVMTGSSSDVYREISAERYVDVQSAG